jgi:alginate O-acetyltransferase complex protein AlgJ
LVAYAKNLQNEGITPIFIAPMQKEYLVADNLPFFAPRQSENSHFMALYNRLLKDPEIHFVDVFGILSSLREKYPIYYTQDFHWTDMSALAVASSTTNLIASLEKSAVRWDHPIMVEYKPTIGSDARFAARLNARESVPEPELVIDWKSTHTINTLDAKQTGLEFESSMLADTNLLPPTCMYGNSFSDGMLRAGLADYYQKLTKLDRSRSLQTVPDLIKGRCKYVIIQILDIQTAHWASLRQ